MLWQFPKTLRGQTVHCVFNYTHVLLFVLWTPQIVLDSANTVADSANSSIFGAILSGTVF